MELLEPDKKCPEVLDFEEKLKGKVVGQDPAVRKIVNIYQTYLAKITMPGRPIGSLLFLGPTGSGKTRSVEASAEILFDNSKAFIKIDCAEFQHSHEISKLVGSPPGYIGNDVSPILRQEAIDQHQTEKMKMTFILFDEIEKASDALWQLLLGILDKATLTLGRNQKVDLSKCVIFMTSNIGSREMVKTISGGIGFTTPTKATLTSSIELDQKLYTRVTEAARKKFLPEFMNRVDKTVVFRILTNDHLQQILEIELCEIYDRLLLAGAGVLFPPVYTQKAKDFLLAEGTDTKYGARHLKRAIERHVVVPFSSLITTKQVGLGNTVTVDLSTDGKKLQFFKNSLKSASVEG